MTKNAWKVEGDFQMGRIRQHFDVEVVADGEDAAREHVLADLGSRHGTKRREIDIKKVEKLATKDADLVTQHRLKE